jgi:hypothetical protein
MQCPVPSPLSIYLTPFIPPPSKERGGVEKRGYAPLRFPVTNYPFPSKEKVEELLKRGLPFTHLAPS